ncbi:ComE operon protein 2 [Listeria fleischmannii]|uniref:ComE operon protein 2 n=1 Tax=Listeria fleischmannii TaxID=1069827 RepID=UPI0002BAEFC3|nr:ComE operon protein 2 [Listeria fleischmannii]EMG28539.1 hypothetical protein LFLEISCH_04690 [Listeria fleischmannii subsp. fleischmannii LU2006-1]
MKRIAWDQFFMAQSHLISSRSTCTRLMVGATIVRDKRIIAGGYNGSIAGGDHCAEHGCLVVEGHCIRTIHAEMNAILQCAKFGASTDKAEMYVTHFPCVACCKSIIQAGIKPFVMQKTIKITLMPSNYLNKRVLNLKKSRLIHIFSGVRKSIKRRY